MPSLMQRLALPTRSLLLRQRQPALLSSFHTSRPRLALSESDRDAAEDLPDRDAKIEHHKNDTVQKAKKGDGEWKPELASNSEQAIKSDDHDMSVEEMQKHGASKAEEGKQPSGSGS